MIKETQELAPGITLEIKRTEHRCYRFEIEIVNIDRHHGVTIRCGTHVQTLQKGDTFIVEHILPDE